MIVVNICNGRSAKTKKHQLSYLNNQSSTLTTHKEIKLELLWYINNDN